MLGKILERGKIISTVSGVVGLSTKIYCYNVYIYIWRA
jgi:hypothetical protein